MDEQAIARVFVSSTFRDMNAERDHLVTVVYPELRERMARLGVDLYDVDLRWGVPEWQSDREKSNSWAYCRKRIDESRPFFIGILGHRYGHVPDPDDILDPEERMLWSGKSITEMEVRYAARTREPRRSFFYLRDTEVDTAVPEEVRRQYVEEENEALVQELREHIRESDRPVRSYECEWNPEANRFESMDRFGGLVLEDLWSGVLRDPYFHLEDAWRAARGCDPEEDPLHGDDAGPIPEPIWRRILDAARPVEVDGLRAERRRMRRFAAGRTRWFKGRRDELDSLRQFALGDVVDGRHVMVVRGRSGTGKSALLARFVDELPGDGLLTIEHFVGASETSTDVRSLLRRLHDELSAAEVRGGFPGDAHPSLNELKSELARRLHGADPDRRIVVVIDALNQLTGGHDLTWIPQRFAAGVRIVVSCIDDPEQDPDSPEGRVMTALKRRDPALCWQRVPPLSDGDVTEIVVEFLDEYCKELTAENIERICALDQARNPLYLLVMLGELRTLGGAELDQQIPARLATMGRDHPDAVSLFGWVLGGLRVFGAQAVSQWCNYLSAGRTGMSSRELADLVDRSLPAPGGRQAALRIERGLRRYLQQRGQALDYFHGQLRTAVARYLPQRDVVALHREISAYFLSRFEGATVDRHVVSELPHHLIEARRWDALLDLLADRGFREQKLEHVGGEALVDDFERSHRELLAVDEVKAARVVRILGDDLARRTKVDPVDLTRVNAWLAYRSDTTFLRELLQLGVPERRPRDAQTSFDPGFEMICRVHLLEYYRRKSELEEAVVLGESIQAKSATVEPRAASLLHYQLGYVRFLRDDLAAAVESMNRSADLSRTANDEVGYWISRCVAMRFAWLAGIATPEESEAVLDQAKRAFEQAATPPTGDPRARRWAVHNVEGHRLELAFARGAAAKARASLSIINQDAWEAGIGRTTSWHWNEARVAILEGHWQPAEEHLAEIVDLDADSTAIRSEGLAEKYFVRALVLDRLERSDRAAVARRRGFDCPADAGNEVWKRRERERP